MELSKKYNENIYALFHTTDRAYMDPTGRFPYCSSRGNEYIFITYHIDSNAILGLPIKNCEASTITSAWKALHQIFANVTTSPSMWILDNETSTALQNAMAQNKTSFQLVTPQTYRSNLPEHTIQTFK